MKCGLLQEDRRDSGRQTAPWRNSGRKSEPEGGGEVVSHDPHSALGAANSGYLTVRFCFSFALALVTHNSQL